MIKSICHHFNPPPKTVEQIHDEMLKDARIKFLEHQKDAEYHAAMARMLASRIERMSAKQVSV